MEGEDGGGGDHVEGGDGDFDVFLGALFDRVGGDGDYARYVDD